MIESNYSKGYVKIIIKFKSVFMTKAGNYTAILALVGSLFCIQAVAQAQAAPAPVAPVPVAQAPVAPVPAAQSPAASTVSGQVAPDKNAQLQVEVPQTIQQPNQKPYIEDKLIDIGTGAISGVYYPAGGAICRLINKERKDLKLKCTVESTPGSVYNLIALKNAELDLAIVQSDWQEHAFDGTSEFAKTGRMENLRYLFSLHDEAFTIVVPRKSSIAKFDDVKGQIVNVGPAGSGVRSIMDELMKMKGWSSSDFKGLAEYKAADQVKALCEGKIDVMLLVTGHPNGTIQEVSDTCEIKLVEVGDADIQKLVHDNPEYSEVVIPGGLYPGIPKDTKSFAIKATVVSTADLSDKIAYNITKVVFDNLDVFKTFHPVFAQLSASKMATEGRTAPYHNGALQYFKEKGLVK
jgi:hypothetical protein